MVINENNSHINSFTKGMNSDTAYDQIQNVQYTYGKNIRITKNQMLGGASDYSTIHEGIITPIPSGVIKGRIKEFSYEILATGSINDTSVIVCSKNNSIIVYKFPSITNNPTQIEEVWSVDNFFKKENKDVSIVLYKELDNVTKLYIATRETPIITLNLDKPKDFYKNREVDYLINNRIMPKDPVYIDAVIDGRLITSQVQYTYRFYNKYGNSTQLAPLTNKIQVISPVRDKEIGNAENTETSIGFTIKIPVTDYIKNFDRMQVFRLSFIKPNEDSEIALIYDDNIKNVSNGDFILNDVGIEPLQTLTIEEFAAMSGLILKPRSIETNQQYMFCSNVEDDTIIKVRPDLSTGSVELVKTSVILADKVDDGIPYNTNNNFEQLDQIKKLNGSNVMSVSKYFQNRNINPELAKSSYNNIFTSSLLRSLRRGETYKYGIVYYDDKGRRSDVHEIGEVSPQELSGSNPTFKINIANGHLEAFPIGVAITLPQPIIDPDEDINIVGCQIVRRSSSEVYQNTLLQVALARPVQQGLMYTNEDWGSENKSPFYPTGFLTSNDVTITPPYYINILRKHISNINDPTTTELGDGLDINAGGYIELQTPEDRDYTKFNATTKNKKLFQAFSSEIDFRRDDVLSKLNTSDSKIKKCISVKTDSRYYKRYGALSIPEWHSINWENDLRFFGVLDVTGEENTTFHRDVSYRLSSSEKSDIFWVFNYVNIVSDSSNEINIKQIKDVKIPGWNDGFTNIQRNGDNAIIDAIKKYKQYTTSIDQYVYNNWVSMCKYDQKVSSVVTESNESNTDPDTGEFLDKGDHAWHYKNDSGWNDTISDFIRQGYIGPGPSCFLIVTKDDLENPSGSERSKILHTSICNIKHSPKIENVQSEEHTTYFGFGNYCLYHLTFKGVERWWTI